MGGEGEARARVKLCELCDSEAELHCAADSAFLCRSCDGKIHSSNFLVARHLRRFLCPNCKSLTGNLVSGAEISPQSPRKIPCSRSCSSILPSSPSPSPSPSSSSSFSCCSSVDSASSSELSSTAAGYDRKAMRRNRRRDGRVCGRGRGHGHGRNRGEEDGVFVNWCESLGLRGNSRDGVVSSASWAMRVMMEKPMVAVFPYKVCLTASFWFGMRVAREAMMTWQNLKRLQEISGVPGKTIVAVEVRISRALRQCRVDLREGWAETEGAT
ncbi:PREDICTED: B-box zinc finger protein 32 [Tarenaya hassleriana]|uniref:B-box zinc finger protein 32 n=1 Tax=Tarenaya hassleriana TaxID=28532 RepID=UPI00053C7505|nr:PREDICTED: B-box zinc finger protein 32 [Tarenaya hassleriana]